MTLAGRRVLLGVSGGIACYKACTIARRMSEAGAAVDVVLTSAAAEFVRPVTFEALTGRAVHTSLWEPGGALDHIRLARDPDLIVVAPATAHLLARAAQGLADDLLTAILLASTAPVVVAPAMNDEMFAHSATQANLDVLRGRGWRVVGPDVGPLAEGPADRPGRMVEPEVIVRHVERAVREPESRLAGKRVLVTAGPTREYLDDVRIVTNPSSGRMGYAMADAAWRRGAEVTLVTGPSTLEPPDGVTVLRVETTRELADAVTDGIGRADLLVMAAAPADYRPTTRQPGKRPRSEGMLELALEPTEDVLTAAMAVRRPETITIGFALESGDGAEERARAKRERKGLDAIVLNRADRPDSGFEGERNTVTLMWPDSEVALPTDTKTAVAEALLDAIESAL